MKEKLLPCAHCGSNAQLEKYDNSYHIHCTGCIVGASGVSKQDTVADWNRRATDAAPLYYVLRRTVGKTTLHYQYAYGPDFSVRVYASTSLADARIFETMKEAQEASAYCPGSEILSIRLLVGGVE